MFCLSSSALESGLWPEEQKKIQQKAQEKEDQKTAEVDGSVSSDSTGSAEAPTTKAQIMAEADALAQTYDYDGAIEKLQSVEGAATDADIITKVAEYTSTRDACVRVNVNEVTHIFYHSLVVDPQKASIRTTHRPQASASG